MAVDRLSWYSTRYREMTLFLHIEWQSGVIILLRHPTLLSRDGGDSASAAPEQSFYSTYTSRQ